MSHPHATSDEQGTERFPIQPAKVGRPALRDETLRRDRLLDWLGAKIHHRVVLVVAEAGYGKTTLLADFSRRTRLRTMWYRLDEEDRDPVAFLNYLVAAGRELDPGFAPTTASMLRELGTGTIPLDQVIATFIREQRSLGDPGSVLIIDDYHLVDESPDIRGIVREMLLQAPDRLSIVLLTRRRPQLPVARLRALGEVVELGSDDLRFLPEETEQLFRESYGRPLEPDVLAELSRRTEGWAASLQLVRTALRDRSPAEVRSFVRSLAGSHEELQDYLAEEVIGDLSPATQQFLMRVAILQVIEPELAILLTGVDESELREHIDVGERAGLLGRRGETIRRSHRYHPLVRDFLLERLRRDIGSSGIRELHRTVARWADGYDWRLATHHYAAAADDGDLHRVLERSLGTIMATGEFAQAEALLERHPSPAPIPAFEVFLSRLDFYRNRIDDAIRRATWAAEAEDPAVRGPAMLNVTSLEYMAGHLEEAYARASAPDFLTDPGAAIEISDAFESIIRTSVAGDVTQHGALMASLMARHLASGQRHFAGISAHNLAVSQIVTGRFVEAAESARNAVELLEEGAPRPEAADSRVIWAWSLAHRGEWDEAKRLLAEALTTTHDLTRVEVSIEAAALHVWFGARDDAAGLLVEASKTVGDNETLQRSLRLVTADLCLRDGDGEAAQTALDGLVESKFFTMPAEKARVLALIARTAIAQSDAAAARLLDRAEQHARQQAATLWVSYCGLLRSTTDDAASVSRGILQALDESPGIVGMLAENIGGRLGDLSTDLEAALLEVIHRHPDRWRPVLRRELGHSDARQRLAAARLLDEVGETQDIRPLRSLAKELRLTGPGALLGRSLAHRLADPVRVEDLGRTVLLVGSNEIPGAQVRRKVLALLLYLLSRPGFSATRDQVLDALWPDHEPTDAINSLNQTLYFLRRVFEPRFQEETSPGYVNHSSDVIWLDTDLITSRSAQCRDLLAAASRKRSVDTVARLSMEYTAPFALDFAYEDWATRYRDSLHAAYLEVIERSALEDIDGGHYDRALELAGRAVTIEPGAEALHVLVIRLCRRMGAHAAAAEHYAVYSSLLRDDLGVEPPPIDMV